jgi:hypothetical protein
VPAHRALDDQTAPYPFMLWLAQLCSAFPGRLPSEVLAEVDRLPVGYLSEVLEMQAYVQAKAMTDAATTAEARKRLPRTPLFSLVSEIELELAAEELKNKTHA